jgi:hypothetical protein
MSEAQQLRAPLTVDVQKVYKKGFPRLIEPQTIPTLAELAEALSPTPNDSKDDYCRQTVEALLRRAAGRLRPADRPGVSELLGLDEEDTLRWAASEMCRQVRLILPPSFGHGRRCLRGCVLV